MNTPRIQLDSARREAIQGAHRVRLTPIETGVLAAMIEQPHQVWSRQWWVDRVMGDDAPTMDRAIDVHVASMCRKLGPASQQIKTVRGQGYRWAEAQNESENA